MKYFLSLALVLFAFASTAFAAQEFYFVETENGHKCLNSKREEGLNPDYLGECGQVSGKYFHEVKARLGLRGTQAVKTIFIESDLSQSFVQGANFSKAHLTEAILNNVSIYESNLSEVEFPRSSLNYVSIVGTNLQNVFAFQATGAHAYFSEIDAFHSNFSFSFFPQLHCSQCNFTSANLARASIRDGLISYSEFKNGDLKWITLSGTMISKTSFDGAKMGLANLDSTTLGAVSFVGSQLGLSNFMGARMESCDFSNADLRGANFTGVVLASGNRWGGAQFDDTTKLPFSESQALQEGMVKVPAIQLNRR